MNQVKCGIKSIMLIGLLHIPTIIFFRWKMKRYEVRYYLEHFVLYTVSLFTTDLPYVEEF